jgi:hypothetical protein
VAQLLKYYQADKFIFSTVVEYSTTHLKIKGFESRHQVSISPIFYEQLFRTNIFCAAFMCLQLEFVIFWRKDFGAKAAHKMLVKLTPEEMAAKVCEMK